MPISPWVKGKSLKVSKGRRKESKSLNFQPCGPLRYCTYFGTLSFERDSLQPSLPSTIELMLRLAKVPQRTTKEAGMESFRSQKTGRLIAEKSGSLTLNETKGPNHIPLSLLTTLTPHKTNGNNTKNTQNMKTMQKNESAQNIHNVQCATYHLR